MASVVIMPRQGQSVERCILTEWFKEVGDPVSAGDLLFAYETDKAAFEEETQAEGILLARFFDAGDEVPVLQNVAVIGEKGESTEEYCPDGLEPSAAEQELPVVESAPDPITEVPSMDTPESPEKVSVSPRARKLAREKRVIVEAIRGTGPGGRIIERDVLEAIKQGKRLTPLALKKMEAEGLTVPGRGKAPYGRFTTEDLVEKDITATAAFSAEVQGAYEDEPFSNVRKIIAGAMHRSLQQAAQLTHHLGANASGMLQLRKAVKRSMEEGSPYNITLNDMVCYAVIRALKRNPGANAHCLGETIRKFQQVNLGLAVDTERGLMVPSLLHADSYSLAELSVRLKSLADSCKAGNVSPDLLSPEAASFTVSNLGNYGVEMFTPVINLPQVAILGVNTIVQRPATLPDGSFGFQPYIGLSLTYDHRALDGGPATLFLADIRDEIEKLSTDTLSLKE